MNPKVLRLLEKHTPVSWTLRYLTTEPEGTSRIHRRTDATLVWRLYLRRQIKEKDWLELLGSRSLDLKDVLS